MFQYYKNWFEFWFFIVIILGVIIALTVPSAAAAYAIAFIAGLFAGRLFYDRRDKMQFPYLMIMAGFVIGYLIGIYYGSRRVVIAMFVIGAILSYKLYDKKILSDTRF